MDKPHITDWIQAIIVTVGIVVAGWEFVLHDRSFENQKKQAVVDLMISGQNESITQSVKLLANVYMSNKQYNKTEAMDTYLKLIPLQQYYDSWAFCYTSGLCDGKLTLDYVCGDAIKFNQVASKLLGESAGDKDQSKLITDCRARAKS